MAIPPFVVDLRDKIGTDPLPLVGVTAVVIRQGRVLLGRREDTGALTPITGIVDPGEEPADAAVREVLEEAGVQMRVHGLAWVHQVPRVTHVNGDRADYLDLTFRCDWVSGEPHPVDGEPTVVGWHDTHDLAEVGADMRARVEAALTFEGRTRFEGGR